MNADASRLMAFIAGLLGVGQTEPLAAHLEDWTDREYLQFGRLIGLSRGLTA